MEQTKQQRRRRRAFTDSFKAVAVELCRKRARSVAEATREVVQTATAVGLPRVTPTASC
jgi:hypothetical protein